jgi:hypothetical protein
MVKAVCLPLVTARQERVFRFDAVAPADRPTGPRGHPAASGPAAVVVAVDPANDGT